MTTRKHAFYGILALVSLLELGITQSARASFMDQQSTRLGRNRRRDRQRNHQPETG